MQEATRSTKKGRKTERILGSNSRANSKKLWGELDARLQASHDRETLRKLIALRLLLLDCKVIHVAKGVGVNRRTLQDWANQLVHEQRLEAVLKTNSERKRETQGPKVTELDRKALCSAIVTGKVKTYKDARDFLEKQRNVRYGHTASVQKMMKKHGLDIEVINHIKKVVEEHAREEYGDGGFR